MPRSRKAFTLIELLVVIVIVGILATIAIPKFSNVKKKGYVTAMKTDLRTLVAAEEAFHADSVYYIAYGDTTKLRFRSSQSVSTPVITVGAGFWSATVTHSQMPGFVCEVALNTVNTILTSAGDGEPVCQ